jgi:hypothetical protein
MNWTIYYGDGSKFAGKNERHVELAPTRDVQFILQDNPLVGIEIVTAADYYVWYDGAWWGRDIFGLWDYLASPGMKRVLFGRMMLREEYNKLCKEVSEDKHGWLTREVKP